MSTKPLLLSTGNFLLKAVGPGLRDEDAYESIVAHYRSMGETGEFIASSITGSGHEQSEFLCLYRWADSGFPVVTMGHRFAAAMALTSATEEVVDSARPPFPGYLLEVPDGIVSMVNPDGGGLEAIRLVLVMRNESKRTHSGFSWAYNAVTENNHVLYRYGVTSSELLPPDIEAVTLEGGLGRSFLVTEHDHRACVIIGRLIVNTALAMSDPRNVSQLGQGRVRHRMNSAFNGRVRAGPTCRTYMLGKDIQLSTDLRPELRRYLSGERRSPNVQVLVSGHYKMQPHGPRSSLRKLIWREPFWRGPEDAPILVRSHVLGEEA